MSNSEWTTHRAIRLQKFGSKISLKIQYVRRCYCERIMQHEI